MILDFSVSAYGIVAAGILPREIFVPEVCFDYNPYRRNQNESYLYDMLDDFGESYRNKIVTDCTVEPVENDGLIGYIPKEFDKEKAGDYIGLPGNIFFGLENGRKVGFCGQDEYFGMYEESR